ncbi:Metallo-hydrolase/oxidoreductase [Laetiporus sulphureus 93-53]|uniref:Metallo-hydrolase/oxidoreductase n=1 Tax=Laetiporus sulphureus 93-53 TaxID=1314785 RepID=A0A165ERQ8_9APHY|nr:Metallo-hydrolase/oxidoreductase [Laetiporus sulphureus 93-53]KZT07630.1 Metallo-hydrolase/oxidoreductase [Laetiporus sulphureus 93-53]
MREWLTLAEFFVWIIGVAVLVVWNLPSSASSRQNARQGSWNTDLEQLEAAPILAAVVPARQRRSAFKAYRLTGTTFLIVQVNDIYSEHPYIYAKLVPEANTILVLDTGCGGASNDRKVEVTSLREFMETVGVEDNGGKPLNEGGKMQYVVALSHCHYDHILGVEQFTHDSPILQSSHSPSFISRESLPVHSLCADLNIRTPSFQSALIPHNRPLLSASGVPLGIVLLHTPGHTPDELALWDADEQMLYVGDTLYEWEPIIFPNEGDIRAWLDTVDALITVVIASHTPEAVLINCGHRSAMRPALEVLRTAKAFMMDVLLGKEPIRKRAKRRGLDYVEYVQASRRYSLRCPLRLVEEARDSIETM